MSANAFKALKDLLPDPALMVGTIAATSNGVATITLPDGGTLQARGAGAVSDKVFFRNGLIEGVAPSLTLAVIVI